MNGISKGNRQYYGRDGDNGRQPRAERAFAMLLLLSAMVCAWQGAALLVNCMAAL